jgi:hypothetical protein
LYYPDDAATAGLNKAASSSTSLNTRKLDEETEVLARKFIFVPHLAYMEFLFSMRLI